MTSFDFDALDHEVYMREALKEADEARLKGELPIGAVVVQAGQVIARGHAQHEAVKSRIAHAEMNALQAAAPTLYGQGTQDCVLYTTVEPCVMCLGAVAMSDIPHVVFALPDRNIRPERMLEMAYMQRHIRNYLGGVLERESRLLWEVSRPHLLYLMITGKRRD